jgi:uncharacterized membrane protein
LLERDILTTFSSGKNDQRLAPRIESLSDLIFGLALSISAFSLISTPPKSVSDVMVDILSFGFSFLVLISVWMRYTAIMSVLPVENRTTMVLNVTMLFLVSIEPYAFNLVSLILDFGGTGLDDLASAIYALDMGGLMAILAFFASQLAVEEKGLVSRSITGRFRAIRNYLFVSAGLFFVTALPQFWVWTIGGTPVRFYFWILPLIISRLKSSFEFQDKKKRRRNNK